MVILKAIVGAIIDYLPIINGVVKIFGSYRVLGIIISSHILSKVWLHCFQNNKEESFWLTNLTADE